MITLTDKTAEALKTWVPAMRESYIAQRIEAGERPESARTAGTGQMDQLFPGDVPAEGQHVMDAVLDGEVVGTLWMGRPFGGDETMWFVFYVEIDPAHRGRGLGRAVMQAAEAWTAEHGGTRVGLSVMGPNTVARSLYDSLGYEVMATGMYKDL